ncbi:MAG: hypothetical protein CUN55_09350 [Phototrophicales bacterium]|nr:MAG: hypothetical protein CUN55_09350 [Phototrophicales bacterium]
MANNRKQVSKGKSSQARHHERSAVSKSSPLSRATLSGRITPSDVLALQRHVGNQRAQTLIQRQEVAPPAPSEGQQSQQNDAAPQQERKPLAEGGRIEDYPELKAEYDNYINFLETIANEWSIWRQDMESSDYREIIWEGRQVSKQFVENVTALNVPLGQVYYGGVPTGTTAFVDPRQVSTKQVLLPYMRQNLSPITMYYLREMEAFGFIDMNTLLGLEAPSPEHRYTLVLQDAEAADDDFKAKAREFYYEMIRQVLKQQLMQKLPPKLRELLVQLGDDALQGVIEQVLEKVMSKLEDSPLSYRKATVLYENALGMHFAKELLIVSLTFSRGNDDAMSENVKSKPTGGVFWQPNWFEGAGYSARISAGAKTNIGGASFKPLDQMQFTFDGLTKSFDFDHGLLLEEGEKPDVGSMAEDALNEALEQIIGSEDAKDAKKKAKKALIDKLKEYVKDQIPKLGIGVSGFWAFPLAKGQSESHTPDKPRDIEHTGTLINQSLYFGTGKSKLSEEQQQQIQQMILHVRQEYAAVMNKANIKNIRLRGEVIGHASPRWRVTGNPEVSADERNDQLSSQRAQSVYEALQQSLNEIGNHPISWQSPRSAEESPQHVDELPLKFEYKRGYVGYGSNEAREELAQQGRAEEIDSNDDAQYRRADVVIEYSLTEEDMMNPPDIPKNVERPDFMDIDLEED